MARDRLTNYKCLLPLIALSLSLVGCVHFKADPNYSGPLPLPEKTQASYAYSKYQGSYANEILEKNSHYTLKRITFPSNHNILPLQHDITIDYYAIDAAGKVPVILVLPILGGGQQHRLHLCPLLCRTRLRSGSGAPPEEI